MHKSKEGSSFSRKKSKIEVNMDFDSLQKQQSKRTILSKNRGSAKSFDLKPGTGNIEEEDHEIQRSTTHMRVAPKIQDSNTISQHMDFKQSPDVQEEIEETHHDRKILILL